MAELAKKPQPYLLMLPLEIKHMIFYQIQASRWKPETPEVASIPPGTQLFRYGSPKSRHFPLVRLTLSGLRATNRQLHRETLDFVTYPKLCLRIIDTLAFKSWKSPEVQALTSYTFTREHIVTVQLHLASNGKYLYRTPKGAKWELDEPVPSSFPTIRKAFKSLSGMLKKQKQVEAPGTFSLKELAAFMVACPRLDFIILMNDHGDFYERWLDPVGDLDAFYPLVKRGVQVQLHQHPSRDHVETVFEKFGETVKGVAESVKDGKNGKVFLSRLGRSHSAVLKLI